MKQRVYKKNRDVLMQLERVERVEKVEETVGEQVADYERLLRKMAERGVGRRKEEKAGADGVGKAGEGRRNEGERDVMGVDEDEGGGSKRRERGKRKVVMDDEEELEGTPEPKKVKEGGG